MSQFDLFLFAHDPALVAAAASAGIDGFVVDWESRGKADRQAGADTEVNAGTHADLAGVRAATTARVICRINRLGPWTREEVDAAVEAGADELLLPMVEAPTDVDEVMALVAGRCALGILLETEAAVARAAELARLPVSRVFVGLNDLAIERGSRSIFDAVADGTVERARAAFEVPFGFAGLTLPDRGSPIPCRLLLAEMERLGCAFSFLRRSYRRDVGPGGDHRRAVAAIRGALERQAARSSADREQDHELLMEAVVGAVEAPLPR
jgi:HpcH/HpaI aldolase/citrate lyase family